MEEALKKFINIWKEKKNVIAIMLTGSYALGLQKGYSDIDIRILFNSKEETSIKGLTCIDGYVFSYLASNMKNYTIRINNQFYNNSKFEATVFAIGKIVYSKDVKEMIKLKKIANQYLKRDYLKKENIEHDKKILMYNLYTIFNYLKTIEEKDPFYDYNYIIFLKTAINLYSYYLNIEIYSDAKVSKIITEDKIYIKKNLYNEFPDKIFLKLWLKSLKKKNQKNITKCFIYLSNKIYKINSNNFEIILELK